MTGYYPSRLGMQFVPVNDLEPVGLSTKFTLLPEVKTNTHILYIQSINQSFRDILLSKYSIFNQSIRVLGISIQYPHILYSTNQSEF